MIRALASHICAHRLGLSAVVGACAVLLAGCVGQGSTSGASAQRAGANTAAGVQLVQVDGAAFEARIGDLGQGLRLGATGATPVPGQGIAVRRQGAALGMDEGALAKRAARAGCAAAGGALNERAIGRFDRQGAWIFAGGCA